MHSCARVANQPCFLEVLTTCVPTHSRTIFTSALRRTERGCPVLLRCYETTTPGELISGRDHATTLWGSSYRMLTHHIRVIESESRIYNIAQITLDKSFKY